MSFDSVAIAAVADELRHLVVGGRVQKVVQAGELTLGVELYARRRRHWLLLSADAQHARVHLADERLGRASDLVSPLLLLLRKHLRHAYLLDATQPAFERVLALTFGPRSLACAQDEADGTVVPPDLARHGDPTVTLIIEAIGRYSNLILVDAQGTILDSLKRVPPELNRYRVILPRRPYVPPPPQQKWRALDVAPADLEPLLRGAPAKTPAWRVLVESYAGVSPQLAREVVYRATGRTETSADDVPCGKALACRLQELLSSATSGRWEPSVAFEGGTAVAFAPYLLTQHADVREVPSISVAVATYYSRVERYRPVDQARMAAQKTVARRREAAARKLESLEKALEGGQRAERYRLRGEAILAHLHDLRRGQATLIADGLEVELDPGLMPADNAQAYFRRYRKAKAALAGVPTLVEETRLYLDYLDQVSAHLALAETVDHVHAIQREVAADRERGRSGGRRNDPITVGAERPAAKGTRPGRGWRREGRSSVLGASRYVSSDGLEILVGRTNRQNEAVTFDQARPEDVWLHARGVPGAHVVVRSGGSEVPERTLREAAQLAAYYSASRGATSVAVDWTRRRQVRRLREGLPGLVSYVGERTLHVSPELPATVQSPT